MPDILMNAYFRDELYTSLQSTKAYTQILGCCKNKADRMICPMSFSDGFERRSLPNFIDSNTHF